MWSSGSGGREARHRHGPRGEPEGIETSFAAPGERGGTEAMGGKVQNVDVKPKDVAGWAAARVISLVVVGPEQPLRATAAATVCG